MMLYKNIKAMVYLTNGDTDFFEILTGILRGDTSAPNLFIICLDYVLWMSIDLIKKNGLTLKKQEGGDVYDRCRLCRWPSRSLLYAIAQSVGAVEYTDCFLADG